MDKNDTKGLHISYAKSDRRDRRRGSDAGSNPNVAAGMRIHVRAFCACVHLCVCVCVHKDVMLMCCVGQVH